MDSTLSLLPYCWDISPGKKQNHPMEMALNVRGCGDSSCELEKQRPREAKK